MSTKRPEDPHEDLTGFSYIQPTGWLAGQTMQVLGLDPIQDDGSKWIVQAQTGHRGHRWTVSRDFLLEQGASTYARAPMLSRPLEAQQHQQRTQENAILQGLRAAVAEARARVGQTQQPARQLIAAGTVPRAEDAPARSPDDDKAAAEEAAATARQWAEKQNRQEERSRGQQPQQVRQEPPQPARTTATDVEAKVDADVRAWVRRQYGDTGSRSS